MHHPKSKFYPTEYFPSLQRIAAQAATVAATPLAAQFFQPSDQMQTVSIDGDPKLLPYPNGTLRTQTAKHTYLCDDNREFCPNQPLHSYSTAKNGFGYQTQTGFDGNDNNNAYSNAAIDPNGNVVSFEENHRSIHFNNNAYFSTYSTKECTQGAPVSMIVNDVNELHKSTQHNYLPTNLITAYNNTSLKPIKHLPNNINQSTAFQTNSMHLNQFGVTKKLDRHRRRKVRIICFDSIIAVHRKCLENGHLFS